MALLQGLLLLGLRPGYTLADVIRRSGNVGSITLQSPICSELRPAPEVIESICTYSAWLAVNMLAQQGNNSCKPKRAGQGPAASCSPSGSSQRLVYTPAACEVLALSQGGL